MNTSSRRDRKLVNHVEKRPRMQSLKAFLSDRLTAAAEEIFGAVEKTIAEYREEVSRAKDLEISRLRMQLKLLKSGWSGLNLLAAKPNAGLHVFLFKLHDQISRILSFMQSPCWIDALEPSCSSTPITTTIIILLILSSSITISQSLQQSLLSPSTVRRRWWRRRMRRTEAAAWSRSTHSPPPR